MKPEGRLRSLDVFRGLTVAAMVLVNSPGSEAIYAPLRHADWHGWTPTDLIFPAFLVIMGASCAFARRDWGRSLKRAALLFGLGLLINLVVYPGADGMRFPGVLQRIALCSLGVEALLSLELGAVALPAAGVLLAGYAVLLNLAPLTPDANVAYRLDRFLFDGHLLDDWGDPEGLLSTLGALATSLIGLAAGLRLKREGARAATALWFGGTALAAAGAAWSFALPLNKHLWTSSYALFSAGLSLAGLAACLRFVEGRPARWAAPFEALGRRALAAYVLAGLAYDLTEFLGIKVPLTSRVFGSWLGPENASLAFALVFTAAALAAARLTRSAAPRSGTAKRPCAPARSRRRSPSRPRTRRRAAPTAA